MSFIVSTILRADPEHVKSIEIGKLYELYLPVYFEVAWLYVDAPGLAAVRELNERAKTW